MCQNVLFLEFVVGSHDAHSIPLGTMVEVLGEKIPHIWFLPLEQAENNLYVFFMNLSIFGNYVPTDGRLKYVIKICLLYGRGIHG